MINHNLSTYREKRDFTKTSEPIGKKTSKGFSYVIQKHSASHLHYDFRLELDGALKSWAIAKGPSIDPQVKRLAIEVEDHPIEYKDFEGIIPKGQYGGGTVMIWDKGTWQTDEDPAEQIEKGHLTFEILGERLKGEWSLLRMKKNEHGKSNWLLVKKYDKFAKPNDNDKILRSNSTSIVSNLELEEITEQKSEGKKLPPANENEKNSGLNKKIKVKKNSLIPKFIFPQLATLSNQMPKGKNWLYEIKFDGYRTLARIENKKVQMLTRNGLNWSDKYSFLQKELQKLPVQNAILDGEIMALDSEGRSNFLTLQEVLKSQQSEKLQYYVFDILFLNNEDLTPLPLIERKEKLEEILKQKQLKNIFYSEHFTFESEEFFKKLCQLNYEGVIAKLANKPYISGRGKNWLKSKCHQRQEMVIGGFTLPSNNKNDGIGALLIGYYKDDQLVYGGKVGTGFSSKLSLEIRKKLEKIKIKNSPFLSSPLIPKNAKFVNPDLVCEVEFTEWTRDSAMRHPSFQGLRIDKSPLEICREKAISAKDIPDKNHQSALRSDVIHGITITHPDKIIYPEENLTKMDLATYYEEVADYILPHVKNRLISVIRCPEGINKECFFQRHENIQSEFIHELKINDKDIEYIYIKDKKGLLTLIQFGVIEIHIWNSKIDDVTKPNQIVFDLDPGPEVPFEDVIEAAADVKLRMDKLELFSFLKTTGGKGLHVVIPLKRHYGFDVIKPFTKAFANRMENERPRKYIAQSSKEKRHGKIFIDYLRNDLTATAVAPFSARAREGATVALPLSWTDLEFDLDPKKFTIQNTINYLQKKSDLWKEFWNIKQSISKKVLKEFGIN